MKDYKLTNLNKCWNFVGRKFLAAPYDSLRERFWNTMMSVLQWYTDRQPHR